MQWPCKILLEKRTLFSKATRKFCSLTGIASESLYKRYNFSQYDVIFSHFGYRAWRDLQYVKNEKIKKVVRFYGCDVGYTPKQPGWREKYKIIFEEYDLLLCEGPYMAKELENLGAPKEKIRWLYLGIDPTTIATELLDTELYLDPLRVLVAGTFTEKKGIEYALEGIFQFACRSGHRVKLTIVGDAHESVPEQIETKKRILAKIAELRKLNNIDVIQTGYVPLSKLVNMMRESLVFLSPSITASDGDIEGGFPVTLMHAAAQGMILIGTDHCDLPEIVRHGENAFMCKQRSAEDICSALETIMEMKSSSLHEFRKKSQEIVKVRFDQSKLSIKLYDMLRL